MPQDMFLSYQNQFKEFLVEWSTNPCKRHRICTWNGAKFCADYGVEQCTSIPPTWKWKLSSKKKRRVVSLMRGRVA